LGDHRGVLPLITLLGAADAELVAAAVARWRSSVIHARSMDCCRCLRTRVPRAPGAIAAINAIGVASTEAQITDRLTDTNPRVREVCHSCRRLFRIRQYRASGFWQL
jgi:hypothetical protein